MVYDTLNRVFCCFYDSNFYYYSSSLNTWYHQPANLNMTRLFHHHVYDPVNNVHLLTGAGWRTYAYKFSDIPGQFPGTGGTAGSSRSFNASHRILLAANPNPCNRSTRIRYGGFNGTGRLEIINVQGARVREFPLSLSGAGVVNWDGRDRQGRSVGAGVYVVRIGGSGTTRQVRLFLSK